MLVYNITIKIDNRIINEWLRWQLEIYIPGILGTGLFYDYRFFELLEQDETEGKTFVTQYFVKTRADYEGFIQQHARHFYDKAKDKWGNQFIEFGTVMQVVQ